MKKWYFYFTIVLHVTLFSATANTRDYNSSNSLGEASYLYVPNFRMDDVDAIDDCDKNETTYFNSLQNFQQFTEDMVVYNSNRIDMYFSGSRQELISDQSTYVDISVKLTEESLRPFEYTFNFNTFFALPHTQNKYKLVLQSYNEDESIDQGNSVGGAEGEERERQEILLGLQFDALGNYFSNVNFELGAKFAGVIPDPYARVKARRSFIFDKYLEIWISNDFSYFILDKVDNKSELRFSHVMYDDMKIELYNSYRYKQKDSDNNITTHEVNNNISISRLLSHKRGVAARAGIYSRREESEALKLQYYTVGVDFRQVVYKNWLYLEFNPALMWREENSFVLSVRGSITMGIIFGESEKYNDRAYRYSNAN